MTDDDLSALYDGETRGAKGVQCLRQAFAPAAQAKEAPYQRWWCYSLISAALQGQAHETLHFMRRFRRALAKEAVLSAPTETPAGMPSPQTHDECPVLASNWSAHRGNQAVCAAVLAPWQKTPWQAPWPAPAALLHPPLHPSPLPLPASQRQR